MTPAERLLSKCKITGECYIWSGAISTNGYGAFRINGITKPVHRVAYLLFNGPIPEGLHIDHTCNNRLCCNHEHLEAVTQDENNKRQGNRKTHCPQGHERTEENTYIHHKHGKPYKRCKICTREDNRARAATF